jgi:hypothetical protein
MRAVIAQSWRKNITTDDNIDVTNDWTAVDKNQKS